VTDQSHHLPSNALPGFADLGGPDFVWEDVRMRLLDRVRAYAMGNKNVQVDVAPISNPSPAGLSIQLMLVCSIPSPVIGERLIASILCPNLQPQDVLVDRMAADLWTQACDARQALLNQSNPLL
jgi:hypothetical protein